MTLTNALATATSVRRPPWRGFYVTNHGGTLAWTDDKGKEHVQTFAANPAELVATDWEAAHVS